ncbi:hypothetical protein AVEN_171999-1 [Araneus ventricosus]|uniref:Uncharacterized protein n=1 Tax=Araneus ventricosus TaxID=182803 RepID=A0A4Y2PDN0_ARAVE|nr:hypothetical protein AVEN_171999-1 [Araneus ventricosus]
MPLYKSTQVGETHEQRGRMTMSLNACVKRKHSPDFGSFVKVSPEERMANCPVVSPSKRADHMCGENSFPSWDSEICHMPLTRDYRLMWQRMPQPTGKGLIYHAT